MTAKKPTKKPAKKASALRGYMVVTCCMDGHSGLDRPHASRVKTLGQAKLELTEWLGDWRYPDSELATDQYREAWVSPDKALGLIEGWDGKDVFRLEEEDGPYIQVERES